MHTLFGWVSLCSSLAVLLALAGCAEDAQPGEGDEGIEASYFDEDYGKPAFEQAPQPTKADTAGGKVGLPVSVDSADTAVWEVKNQWADKDTAAARLAGPAWAASSGLTWDQKYAAWIEAGRKIDGHDTYYQSFELVTPWGKTLPAPSLECAETSIFLRALFASWYNLPFFLEAVDGTGKRVYFGHFGARTASGVYNNTPAYKRLYRDYSSMTAASIEREGWPQDAKLRAKKIYGTSSDLQGFLGEDVHAGTYFDEVVLNKRVGHFMLLLLSYFGSVNLADSNNTFNLVPSAIQPGDTLLERWQRRGIGHTLVVKHVAQLEGGKLEAQLVSGSMPRRQPKWEDGASSKRYFTLEETGGEGENSDGDAYAKLGGGIKRWRVAQVVSGKWSNVVLPEYRDVWIPNYEYARIAARPGEFDLLLGEVSPEELRAAMEQTISDNREHLRRYPASCSARTRREAAFKELYELNRVQFGTSQEDTDRQHRKLEDYVFAELVYEKSKTCCWNSTTAAMFEIVMDYNEGHVWDDSSKTCNDPVVFMSRDGGDYGIFREHAALLGRQAEWVAWSEDEPCAQRGVDADTEQTHAWAPMCSIADSVLGFGQPTNACSDAYVGNSSRETAATVAPGTYSGLKVCNGAEDWFKVTLAGTQTLSVAINFAHASGDLDLEVYSAEGNRLTESAGSDDSESLQVPAAGATALYVKVFGYSGAANTYALTLGVN